MFINDLVIQENRAIKNRFYKLILESEEIALHAQPGQFLHLQVQHSIHPLLRRPFSINRIRDRFVEILYEVIGDGTRILSERKKGEIINCHGPLGNSFSEDFPGGKALLVGGGIGTAPLLFLGERLLKKHKQVETLLGYRSLEDVVGEENFIQIGLKPMINTDDGTYGVKGFVTDLLETHLKKDFKVFTCGPIPMLAAVSNICLRKQVSCEVSIHNFMGCGFGVCLGCVFPTKSGFKRVCKEGPIFDGQDLVFK